MTSEDRKEKAMKILEKINEHPELISWDPDSEEVSFFGTKKDATTNIGEILDFITKGNPSKTHIPAGASRFFEAMRRAGLDPTLIPNKDLKKLVEPSVSQMKGLGLITKNTIQWKKLY